MIILYGIANCDTIRKTRNWLAEHNVDYQFHDYKKAGCSGELAKTLLARFSADELINKRGTTWRKLPESDKQALDGNKASALMQQHPSLIKRPLLCINNNWLLGYDTDRMQRLINQ